MKDIIIKKFKKYSTINIYTNFINDDFTYQAFHSINIIKSLTQIKKRL